MKVKRNSCRADRDTTRDSAIQAQCEVCGIDFTDFVNPSRKSPKIVAARREFARTLRRVGRLSYPMIARVIGWNDHVSAMNAVKAGGEE